MTLAITLTACLALSAAATGWWTRAIAAGGANRARPSTVYATGLGMLFVVAFGTSPSASVLVPVLLLGGAGVIIAHVDVATRRIPDAVCLTAYPMVGAGIIIFAVSREEADGLLRSAVAAAACSACYLVLFIHGGVGFADVKLAGLIGLVTGWMGARTAIWALVLGFVVGALVGVYTLLRRRRGETIAFGPSMLVGCFIAIASAGE